MQRLIFGVILLLGAIVLATHLTEGRNLLRTLEKGVWWWVILAIAIEFLFLLNQSAFYKALYRFFDLEVQFKRLFLLILASAFLTIVTPGGALSGSALIVHYTVRKGVKTGRAIMLNFIYFLFDYLAFILILAIGFIYLATRRMMQGYEVLAAGLLLALVLLQISLLLLAYFKNNQLIRFIETCAKKLGRFFRWPTALLPKITSFIEEIREAAGLLINHRQKFWQPATHAILVEVLSLAALKTIFLAFRQPISPGSLIAGYAIGSLFMIVSITPNGVGIMEGMMTMAFTSLGVPLEKAIVVTLVYRGITFWLPFVAGIISFKVVNND